MVFSLNLFPPLLLQAATTANSASFSQTELVARYPAIAAASAVLLGLGFACDIYLFLLLWRRVHPSPTEAVEPMLRVAVKPWTMQDLAFVTGAVILAFALANSLMSIGLKLAHVNDERSTPWFLTLEMLLSMGCLLAMRAFFQLRNIDWRQAVGFPCGSPGRALASGAILFLAVLPPLAGVSVTYEKLCHLAGVEDTPQSVVDLLITSDSETVVALIVTFAVAVAPVFEEFFFRGFAYPALKQRWGCWRALTVVSAAFAFAHWHIPSIGPLFFLALGLGLAYEWTGSLLTPITMHALFNAMNVVLLLYVRAHS